MEEVGWEFAVRRLVDNKALWAAGAESPRVPEKSGRSEIEFENVATLVVAQPQCDWAREKGRREVDAEESQDV